jgi:class 3 adenylate cyclase
VIEVELPTGTVTLLFTDIEGSTRMLRSLGDDYGAVLRAHRAILRDAVGRHGGVEFGTEGDAFLAFPAAAAAPRFPDGVWFVPLATVADPARVGLAVVEALPASAALGRDVLGVAADDVAEGRAMTFDQALDSAAAWADQRRTLTT